MRAGACGRLVECAEVAPVLRYVTVINSRICGTTITCSCGELWVHIQAILHDEGFCVVFRTFVRGLPLRLPHIHTVMGRLSLRQNIPRSQVNIKLGINPAALPRYIPTNMCLPQGCRDRDDKHLVRGSEELKRKT